MLSKSLLVFAFLAIFACQGISAANDTHITRASIGDLINQIKNVISGLNGLVSGVLGDGLSVLKNLLSTINVIQDKFLNEGLSAINEGIGNVLEFVANKTVEAAELGIDITQCILGTNQTLVDLGADLGAKLTTCITDIVSKVLDTVNAEIKNLNDIVKTITAAPVKLSKCIISLRPISCLTKLLNELSTMVTTLPGQIAKTVKDATDLVASLPNLLLSCVTNITASVTSNTEAIIEDIGKCVDGLISQVTTTASPSTTTDSNINVLINQVKEIISKLNEIKSDVINGAKDTLTNEIEIILQAEQEYINQGNAIISQGVGVAVDFIKSVTEQAAEFKLDIAECVTGKQEELEALLTQLTTNLTDCTSDTVSKVQNIVNSNLQNVASISKEIDDAQSKLDVCVSSSDSVTCIENLINELSALSDTVPTHISGIVDQAAELVKELPAKLQQCIYDTVQGTAQTDQMIYEINMCVADKMSQSANQ